MHMNLRFSLLACIGMLIGQMAWGQSAIDVRVHDSEGKIALPSFLEVLPDTVGGFQISDVRMASFSQIDSVSELQLPLNSALWAVWHLTNSGEDTVNLVLGTGAGDTTDFYWVRGNKILHQQSGVKLPYQQREIPFYNKVWFAFELAPLDSVDVYVRSREQSGKTPIISPVLYDRLGFEYLQAKVYQFEVSFVGYFQAILLIMMLYNLMIFATTREATYFWYALYLFSLVAALFFETTTKALPQLGFSMTEYNNFSAGFWLTGTSLWYFLFGRSFLKSWIMTPKWDKAIKIIIGIRALLLGVALITFAFFEDFGWVFLGNMFLLAIEILFLLAYFLILARKRNTIAWFFIIGSSLVFIFGFLQLFLRDYNEYYFIYFLGSILLEILIFSLGLGYRVRKSQKDKLRAEQDLNRELSKINTAFGRFVPHDFLKHLGRANATEVLLGDQVEREVTVLFADIRAYTTLSEKMTPKENFDFLNAYLGRVGPVIQQEGGFVNQYYGDGIMALFPGKPDEAVQAAIRIQQVIDTYNQEREAKDRVTIRLGIGIHTGQLMMGIIGDALRMDAGVVSDTVNTASRMEGLTKHFRVRILISETTRKKLSKPFLLRPLGKVIVKGRASAMEVFECFQSDMKEVRQQKTDGLDQFTKALNAYNEGQFQQAIELWKGLEANDDETIRSFLQKTKHYQNVDPDTWTGIEVMDGK